MNESNETTRHFDILVIGAGVTGSAFAYIAAKYSTVGSVGILEKHHGPAMVNSHHTQNSQTLHFGDIETNYTIEKARRVKKDAELVRHFVETEADSCLYQKTHKMVLGVGHDQVSQLGKRYTEFNELFPDITLLDRQQIQKIEPSILEGRKSSVPVTALYSPDGYAINYSSLAKRFLDKANTRECVSVLYNHYVEDIRKVNDGYVVITNRGVYHSTALLIAAGAHSLLLSRKLGIGCDYGLLSVAGSFYVARQDLLHGKVYTIQRKKLPFAAIHGDPDVVNASVTRFGPTAMAIPFLERRDNSTISEFHSLFLNWRAIRTFISFMADIRLSLFAIENVLYEIPLIGKWLFLRKARKIIPALKWRDLHLDSRYGGLRPQILNLKESRVDLGEAKIARDNIIVNITPSPGASTCLGNAVRDIQHFAEHNPGWEFNKESFSKDFAYGENS